MESVKLSPRMLALAPLVALFAAEADADSVTRGGLFVGGSAGFGMVACSGCASVNGLGLNLRLGATLPQRDDFAVLIDSSIVVGKQVEKTLWSGAYVAAGQYWITPNIWVKAGAGVGRLGGGINTVARNGLTLVGAAGYEIGRTESVALSLEGRIASAKYDFARVNNYSVLVGATWY